MRLIGQRQAEQWQDWAKSEAADLEQSFRSTPKPAIKGAPRPKKSLALRLAGLK